MSKKQEIEKNLSSLIRAAWLLDSRGFDILENNGISLSNYIVNKELSGFEVEELLRELEKAEKVSIGLTWTRKKNLARFFQKLVLIKR